VTSPGPGPHSDPAAAEAGQRARRRAEVFGDVLPETTGDDRDPGPPADGTEEWLRRNVPPHHG
jgi:hypothetical protein